MAFLSDRTLRALIEHGRLKVEPYDASRVQPASIDLTLDRFFKEHLPNGGGIDPKQEQVYRDVEVNEGAAFRLPGLGFCLASTVERVTLPSDMIGRLEGKSSLGRLGLTAHITAGFFDPGFDGHPTLEIFNANTSTIFLYPGMPICQMSFAHLTTPAEFPYGHDALGSKYQHQERGPKGSQFHRNF